MASNESSKPNKADEAVRSGAEIGPDLSGGKPFNSAHYPPGDGPQISDSTRRSWLDGTARIRVDESVTALDDFSRQQRKWVWISGRDDEDERSRSLTENDLRGTIQSALTSGLKTIVRLDSGRPKGAKANKDRAKKWREEARKVAISLLTGKTPARDWTNEAIASELCPRLRVKYNLKNLSARTVEDAIKGVRQEIKQQR